MSESIKWAKGHFVGLYIDGTGAEVFFKPDSQEKDALLTCTRSNRPAYVVGQKYRRSPEGLVPVQDPKEDVGTAGEALKEGEPS